MNRAALQTIGKVQATATGETPASATAKWWKAGTGQGREWGDTGRGCHQPRRSDLRRVAVASGDDRSSCITFTRLNSFCECQICPVASLRFRQSEMWDGIGGDSISPAVPLVSNSRDIMARQIIREPVECVPLVVCSANAE